MLRLVTKGNEPLSLSLWLLLSLFFLLLLEQSFLLQERRNYSRDDGSQRPASELWLSGTPKSDKWGRRISWSSE